MSFFRDAASLLATSAVVMPLGLLTSIVLARLLTPEDLGFYWVIFNLSTLSVLLSQLGWPSAAIYRLRRLGISPSVVTAAGTTGMTAVGGVVVGLGLLFEEPITRRLLGSAPVEAFRLGLLLVPFQLWGRFFVGVSRGTGRFSDANWYRLAVVGGTLLVVGGVLLLGEAVLVAAVGALAFVHGAAALGLGLAVVMRTGWSWRWGAEELGGTLRYGLKTYVQSIAGQIHEQIDIFMLAALMDAPEQVGFYAIAVGIVNRLKLVPDAISAALFPHAAGASQQVAGPFTARASRHSALWAWVMAASIAVIAPLAVPLLWGPAFGASVPPLLILLPGGALLTTYMVLARYFMAVNRQQVTVATQITSTVVNVVLNWLLIPRAGILGAAVASLASYTLEAVLVTAAFGRATGEPARDVLIVRKNDLTEYRERLRALVRRWSG